MKVSNYNFYFEFDNKRKLLYNSFTNSMALMESDKYEQLVNFNEKKEQIPDAKLLEDLKMGGFIIEDNYSEFDEIKLRMLSGRFDTSSLGLTIAPTSDCNFRCVYCYEKDVIKEQNMSEEIQENIIEFVEGYAGSIKNLQVTWYGGEPLMALDTIEKLSRKFIEICDKNNIIYNAGMITNGYLLNRNDIELLNDLKVDFYQITIDGNKETHNQRRPLKGGEETFDGILKNIEECFDILPNVALRINVDRNNINGGDEIIAILQEKNLLSKIKPYLGKVTNDNDNPSLCNSCYTSNEFALEDLNFNIRNTELLGWNTKYPDLKMNFCGADSVNSFVINSDGMIYKCWNDIGIESKAVGNIKDNIRRNTDVLYSYMLFEPAKDKCVKCKVLPNCMGGCPHYRVNNKEDDRCSVYKNALYEHIKYVAEQIINERAKVEQ